MADQFHNFWADALQSDFFAGGLALGAFGVAAATLRVVFAVLLRLIMRRIRVSVTLDNRSNAYTHFILWMEQADVLRKAKQVRMTDNRWSNGTKGYAPAPGRHWFFKGGKICLFERSISERTKIGDSHNQQPMETLKITIYFGHVATILTWINEGASLAKNADRIGPGLHLLKGDYWEYLGDVPRRALETVLVDDDRVDRLCSDMRWFYGACDWYGTRGVPWRRGYLLYGPPGTGKSSMIRALASELRLDIASLDVGRASLTDDDLREAMMSAPKNALIAIEDIDAVFVQRKGGNKKSGVSFSGLLNAIDGVAAQEGHALIMTTNHRDRLDTALIRPGRADVHVELGHVNAKTATRMFARFFPDRPELCLQFQTNLGAAELSPAVIQGWLLSHCNDAKAAASATGICPASLNVAAE